MMDSSLASGCSLAPYRLGAHLRICRFVFSPGLQQQAGVVLQNNGHQGVLRSQCLLVDYERPQEEWFSLGELVVEAIEHGQVVEGSCDAGMFGAEYLLNDCKRAVEKRLGLGEFTLVAIESRQEIKASSDVRMVRSQRLLANG